MATTGIRGANAGTSQIQPGSLSNADLAAAANIALTKLAKVPITPDGVTPFTADQPHGTSDTVSASNFKITKLADPVNPQDAATRAWVLANITGGVVASQTARVASTANVAALSGTQTIDGIALSVGDVVLLKNQTTPSANGLYVVASGAWTRHASMDAWAEVPGMLVSVQQGTTNADTVWLSTADTGGTLGTTSITFTQLPGPSDIIAGAGLLRTGQQIDIQAADNSLTINADNMQVKLDPARCVTVVAAGIGVNPDNTTIEANANALRVKPGSIGDTQLGVVYQKQANIVIRETPGGTINGVNATFTLAATPVAGTEEIFLNGILLEPGAGNDYTIATNTITMLTIPQTGDRLKARYLK